MKLISIEILGNGESGWSTEPLFFGKHITHISGPNSCGKTPIVQSIAFCLGYPCLFREDIYQKCSHAVLTVESGGVFTTIIRAIEKEVEIKVVDSNNVAQEFYNENDYSEYLFDIFGLERNNLVSSRNESTKAYMSTLLPLFFLDQDEGYKGHYYSSKNFILNQFEEMIRIVFDLPPKNPFNVKKNRIDTKNNLEGLDKRVNALYSRLENQREKTSHILLTSAEIYDQIESLDQELVELRKSHSGHDESINALDRIIANHRNNIRSINDEIKSLENRSAGLNKIVSEIYTEIDTLNLNEEARRLFILSGDVCGSSNCSMFSKSSSSYSKNLLYLKDQIKDLERNDQRDRAKIEELSARKSFFEELTKNIVSERNEALQRSEVSVLVDTISEIKSQLFELQNWHEDLEEVEKIESLYFDACIERNRVLDVYNSLSRSSSKHPTLIKLKSKFKSYLVKWVEGIGTINVNLNINWKSDFVPLFGKESIEQIKGSTKTRVVLAYHAALIELMLRYSDVKTRFVILDTPKQHEIDSDDLNNYMSELKSLCAEFGLQVIFSSTEFDYPADSDDVLLLPMYPGEKQNMFLKSIK
ncbi:hypothetical protein P7M41_22205 [Vibrio parahaemolyticus]|uniref:AAA family ATPase n=1 Tax=Vibrio parahaemolyticus TaxID=670 RepID=UPI000C9A578B|nr:hypothetical protein [Vibrio parahaemolyticus]HAS6130354.1 hypothetical protein [Vibrio vulnificus]MBE4468273.1 hypothetical protein [Vibrio parahaemolyticus]MDF4259084.1 hypothetical protein [Vibrio parahaemolyticus]MDF4264213.1 hypothetical protein [Vibrio parahaemolyticus]MDF4326162.1 hypothetical protein [Vibrio parahaemolyticus]